MLNGEKIEAKVSQSWKKSFSYEMIIPHKLRNCNCCKEDSLCDKCDKLVNRKKKISMQGLLKKTTNS